MSQRDQKTLMILLLSVVGAGVGIVLLQSLFLGPLGEYNRQIERLETEVDLKEQQVSGIIRDMPRLKAAQKQSLPGNQVKASGEYFAYLDALLPRSGLTNVGVTPPPPPANAKAGPAVATAPNAPKKPGHTVLKYTVHAKGTLAAVVSALEKLQRTPILHRVNNLRISRQESAAASKDGANLLTVEFTIEAMIAAGTSPDQEPALTPNTSLLLPTSKSPRRYTDIARKNIFIGFVPPLEYDSSDPIEDIIAQQVRLDQTEPTSGEAFLRNLIFQVRETRLWSKPNSGFQKFQIRNEEGTKVLVDARVLRIDQRDVYFQVKEDVYGIHLGQTVAQAMRRPLSQAELDALELTSLIRDYDPKADPTTNVKKTSKGGKKKG